MPRSSMCVCLHARELASVAVCTFVCVCHMVDREGEESGGRGEEQEESEES